MYLGHRHFQWDVFKMRHLDDPETLAAGPAYPSRLKSFLFACAVVAQEDHIEEMNKLIKASAGSV